MRPEIDQLPGVCRDYFTVQGWVDFNNGDQGVTIATPDNPLVQLGDFSFAHNRSTFTLDRALLLSWVTNNYWETNFPAYQPGTVTARYHILPYAGEFNEDRAQRLAAEAVDDEQNRPDDEQHERHDAQQFVQFGALLQERREKLFKGCHTSGRFEVAITESGMPWARSSGGMSARISARPQ